jgi:metal-responsive CopG/Arc/MetJ family transcriptional regulator
MANRQIVTLSIPQDILKEVQEVAREEELSKSELFRRAIIDFIGRRKWEEAKKIGRKTAQEMKITIEDIEKIVHDFRKA